MPREPKPASKHSLVPLQQLGPSGPKRLAVQGGFDAATMIPSVILEDMDGKHELTLEDSFALANQLYLAADAAEADGFVMYFFSTLTEERMPMGRRIQILRRLRAERPQSLATQDQNIKVIYGYGQNSKLPFVDLTIDGRQHQITAVAARELAHNLIICAEHARNDVQVVQLLLDASDNGLPIHVVEQILGLFSEYRETIGKTQVEHDHPHVSSA